MQLLLTTPRQHDYHNPLVELREKRVRQALADLPVLNMSRSVPILLEQLTLLNQETIDPRTRLRLLEIYRQPVISVYQSFDAVRLRQEPISRQQRENIRENVARLCLELANGYKVLVKQGCDGGKRSGPEAWLHPAIFLALDNLACALLFGYRGYSVLPPFGYLEAHQLYRCAEAAGVLETTLDDAYRGIQGATVGSLYRCLMLLGSADPFQLPSDSCLRVFGHLDRYQGLCAIQASGTPADPAAGVLLLDLEGDTPPKQMANALGPDAPSRYRTMDTRAVVQAIQSDLAQLANNRQDPAREAERQVLQLLDHAFQRSQREQTRTSTLRPLNLCFGIDTIHRALEEQPTGTDQLRSEGNEIEIREPGEMTPTRVRPQAWQVVNENETGLCARRPHGSGKIPQAGELVAIVPPADDVHPSVQIGMVCWTRAGHDHTLEMGIELFPGEPAPIRIRIDAGTTSQALLIRADPATGNPARLVARKNTCNEHQPLAVQYRGHSLRLICQTRQSMTHQYEHFTVESGNAAELRITG